MIDKKRQLWLMANCCVYYTSQEEQSKFAERFVNQLDAEEVEYCLEFMKR